MAGELILVVEDNDRNRKLVCDVLEFAGMRVVAASTASEGLTLARRERPDLILMDIGLPDQDGASALLDLKADTETAQIPVVAVTAYAMQGDRQKLLDKGFDGYVAKPIDVARFPQQVTAYLPGEKTTEGRTGPSHPAADTTILVADDTPANARLLEAVLAPYGYQVVVASSGHEALDAVERLQPQLLLLDVVMPDMDGYEVCRRIRSNPATSTLPVVMVTASAGRERLQALEAGADDFVSKPFNQAELLARIQNLVRIREYQDRIEAQAAELARLNRALQERIEGQVAELERLRRLRRFVAPQVADAIVSSGGEDILNFHRTEITVLFCDLRGFTAFAANAEPEESARVMAEYHDVVGDLVRRFEATVGHFAGDGVMVFFNDPVPCSDHAMQGVRMALVLRDRILDLGARWRRTGYDLGFGIGISSGYATLGEMGFESRRDYGAIGGVCNLASRLCDEAAGGQVLIGPRTYTEVEDQLVVEAVGGLVLKGFAGEVEAWNVVGLREDLDG